MSHEIPRQPLSLHLTWPAKSFPAKSLPPLASLFCNNSAPRRFVFTSLQPLFNKHPGGGAPLTCPTFRLCDGRIIRRTPSRPLLSTSYNSLPIPPRLQNHLF